MCVSVNGVVSRFTACSYIAILCAVLRSLRVCLHIWQVKMITGDQTAIVVEACRMLGMGTKVYRGAATVVSLSLCLHTF